MINLPDYKRIHCIGIGGIGLSAIAEILISRGYDVSGSDMRESEITERLMKKKELIYIWAIERKTWKRPTWSSILRRWGRITRSL